MTSDEGHALTSICYYDGTWDHELDGETITFNNGTITADAEGHATFYAITAPLDAATLTVEATTTTDKIYGKKFGATLSLSEGDIAEYGVALELIEGPAVMNKVTNASDATVNGKNAIKAGTSSAAGTVTITVGRGAKSLVFYAAAWKDEANTLLSITPADKVQTTSFTLIPDTGITGNSPYTLSGVESAFKCAVSLDNISTETVLSLTADKRFVIWGATYSTKELEKFVITCDSVENGTISASSDQAIEGTLITLRARPNSGYVLDSWSVTKEGTGESVTVSNNSFTMPAANVNVTASFVEGQPDPVILTYANFTNTSYSASENTFNQDGVTYGYVNMMKNGSNGTPSGWAKEQVIQCKTGSTFYNKTQKRINSIRVYLAANTNSFTISYGSTGECKDGNITRPTTPTGTENVRYTTYVNKSTGSGTTDLKYYDFDLSASKPEYFKLTTGSSTIYIYKMEIQYAE